MIAPSTSPGAMIYCTHCRDLVAIVDGIRIESTQELIIENVTFKDPATDLIFSAGETETCKSCGTAWYHKGYFTSGKPSGPCLEGFERERASLLESVKYFTDKSIRQGRLIASIADAINNKGDGNSDLDLAILRACKDHLNQEQEILRKRMRAIEERST